MNQRLTASNQAPLVAPHPDQIAADLCWSFASPDLLTNQPGLPLLPDHDWNNHASDIANVALLATPDAPHRRLGIYFEQLIIAGLEQLDGYELIAHSVQINHQGITQGELDYLIKTPDGRTLHVEVAIKLYLGIGDTRLEHQWLGPNSIDRLDLKIASLKNKQLPRAQSTAAQQTLQARFGDLPIDASYALVKGFLFHPINASSTNLPQSVNPKHNRGWWLHYQALDQLKVIAEQHGLTRWAVLYKPWWLTTAANRCRLLDLEGMLKLLHSHFGGTQAAILIVGFTADDDAEASRGFIVPNHWPGDGKTPMSEHYLPHA